MEVRCSGRLNHISLARLSGKSTSSWSNAMQPTAIYRLGTLQDLFRLASQPRKQAWKVFHGIQEFVNFNFQTLENWCQIRRNCASFARAHLTTTAVQYT